MRPQRPTIPGLILAIALIAAGLAALRSPSESRARIALVAAAGVFGGQVLRAVRRNGVDRASAMTGAVVGISYLWMMLTPLEETIPTSRALLALRPFVLREPVGLVELPRDRLDESFSEWASRWRAEPEILNVEQGSRDYIRLSYRVNLTEEFMRTGHALFAVMLGTLAAGLIAFVGTGRERRVKPGRARSPEAPG